MEQAALTELNQFLGWLRDEKQLSPHTQSAYKRDLDATIIFCDKEAVNGWQQLNSFQVRKFASSLHSKGLGGRSIQRRLSAMRSFFRYLVRKGSIKSNPAQGVRSPKSAKKLPHSLDVDHLQQLLDVTTDDWFSIRDLAMLEITYSSGIRLAEMVGLELANIDLDTCEARVTGKGNKVRITPIGRKANDALRHWLSVRNLHAETNETALFINRNGTRISARNVQQRFKLWSLKQGQGTRLHPHALRHSCASHLLESSHDLRAVQELLGHANLTTTQVYTHLDFQHLATVYDNAHPRSKKK